MAITIRRAEPDDCELVCEVFADESAYSGTLQTPFPSRVRASSSPSKCCRVPIALSSNKSRASRSNSLFAPAKPSPPESAPHATISKTESSSATKIPAELLKLDRLGTLARGKSADFIVLDANPLENIGNTKRIANVYQRGIEVDRATLQMGWQK